MSVIRSAGDVSMANKAEEMGDERKRNRARADSKEKDEILQS